MKRATQTFFARDTIEVARDLLGHDLVRRLADGRTWRGRIVETEAYLGADDPACHSFAGRRTPRVETMYGRPGLAYVYLIYGMYHCLNVVTRSAEAVLIRAIEPLDGGDPLLTNGPGKLCRALGLTRAHDGVDLTASAELYLVAGARPPAILEGPRVGLGGAHDAVHWPLRYGSRGSPALSKPRFADSP